MQFVLKNIDYHLVEIMKKNLENYIKAISDKEKEILAKLRFTSEHKFEEESRILRIKLTILSEIRCEAELINSDTENRPKFYF